MKIAKVAFKSVLPFNVGIQDHVQKLKQERENITQRIEKRIIENEHNKIHRAKRLFEQQQLVEKFSDNRVYLKNLVEKGQIINIEV